MLHYEAKCIEYTGNNLWVLLTKNRAGKEDKTRVCNKWKSLVYKLMSHQTFILLPAKQFHKDLCNFDMNL